MIDTVSGGGPCMETDREAPTPLPPPPHRRPRVREVSSRFMSPAPAVSSSNHGSDLHHLQPIKSPSPKHGISTPIPGEYQGRQHRLKTTERRRQDKEGLLTCCAHENLPETIRSLDTPFGSHNKHVISGPIRKQRVMKENAEKQHSDAPLQFKIKSSSSRPETPTVPATSTSCADRSHASRFRNFQHQTKDRETTTDAAKLLQSSGLSSSFQSHGATPINPLTEPDPSGDLEKSNDAELCTENSIPIGIQSSRTKSLPDTRSSMPEGDILPSLSTTRPLGFAQSNRNIANCQTNSKLSSASPCSRSLNLPFSRCENSITHSFKNGERTSPHPSKPSASTSNLASLCLPPQPTCTKLGVDSRKGRKPFASHEQVHSLKLHHNHYLQWRFANAKAEASMHIQQKETESKLYSLGLDNADLRDAVKQKRVEVELLRRTISLVTIAEAQMSYLVEWSALEEDYSNSLSGSIHALVNTSLRLPVSGNIQVDLKQIAEALQLAMTTMEMIGAHAERFMPKAKDLDALISDLARVIGGERVIVEECGDLLFKTYKSQVEDCSLRGHLMQLECSKNSCQP